MTAALNGLVAKYNLEGQVIDEVVGGAVVTHSKDFNLAREAVITTKLDPSAHPASRCPGLRNQLASRPRQRGEDRHRPDRMRHCRRLGHDVRCADRGAEQRLAQRLAKLQQAKSFGEKAQNLRERFLAVGAGAERPERRRAAHRPVDGPAIPS